MARVLHGQGDWLTYHITTRTLGQAFYFARPADKLTVVSALAFYRERGDYQLFAFVVMDNHVHFVIQPAPGKPLGDILRDFKRWCSRRNTSKPAGQSLWERRYDDNRIASARELRSVITYIHHNPVRAGIVSRPQDYRWSSIHNYGYETRPLIEIDDDWWAY